MTLVIVAAHGQMAEAMLGSAAMIVGDVSVATAVTFVPGQGPEDLLDAYDKASAAGEPTLLLVDLLGGSPYNAAARWAVAHDGSDVVTGVNLPILLEVLPKAKRGKPVEDLVAAAEKAGAMSIKSFRASYQPPTDQEDDEGDDLL